MTGFGVASGEVGALQIRVEIRSVNHRFLQLKSRLPSEFSYLEPEVEAVVKKKLERGAVVLGIHAARTQTADTARVDIDAAKRYQKLLGDLAKKTGVQDDLALSHLIGLPGVLGGQEAESANVTKREKALMKIVGEATVALIEMREAEGVALEKDLLKNAGAAERIAKKIAKRMPKVVKEHHASTKRRVDELLGGERGQGLDPRDLAREVALLAERLDVEEELSRLDSHLEQLKLLLAKGGVLGRKLDFLIQELQREANTIGSKCSDAEVAHAVVELKTLVERLREQVQNVE